MDWVLERDLAKEGVWLEPLAVAQDPAQAIAAQVAKKHGPRNGPNGLGRRASAHSMHVPWTLPDRRKVVDRARAQAWPLSRDDWLKRFDLGEAGTSAAESMGKEGASFPIVPSSSLQWLAVAPDVGGAPTTLAPPTSDGQGPIGAAQSEPPQLSVDGAVLSAAGVPVALPQGGLTA